MASSNETLNIQIQNRLVEQLTLRNRQLEFVNSFTEHIQNSVDIADVINMLAKTFKSYFGHQFCEIYLIDKERELLVQAKPDCDDFNSDHKNKKCKCICFGENLIGKVAVDGLAKIETKTDEKEFNNDTSFLSEIAIPLIHNGKDVVGVIYSNHKEVNFFNQAKLKSIITMASIAATKILQIEHLSKIKEYQIQLEEYVHIVSHDLKSPLRSINSLIAWVKEDNLGKLGNETLRHIELIDSTLLQMDNLITNTLKYSRIDYDGFDEEEVNLNELLKDIENTLNLDENFNFLVSNNLPTLRGNRTKFMQIFQNLIENAVKYIDKSQGIISIGFTDYDDFYEFSVQDNGIGIKEVYYEKIFQIFQTLSDHKNSSGVGLSIVKKLVNNYGGKIWLDSKLGQGTTFYFTLKK